MLARVRLDAKAGDMRDSRPLAGPRGSFFCRIDCRTGPPSTTQGWEAQADEDNDSLLDDLCRFDISIRRLRRRGRARRGRRFHSLPFRLASSRYADQYLDHAPHGCSRTI